MSGFWEKRVTDGQMDRQTEGLTNKILKDLLTNAEGQKIFQKKYKNNWQIRRKINHLKIKFALALSGTDKTYKTYSTSLKNPENSAIVTTF